ncbi:MAG: hypothetical protein L6437_06325 [Kiritimatiellae bacterium]|nr:hypothetical protein [Kiritimatiellia bacterium]
MRVVLLLLAIVLGLAGFGVLSGNALLGMILLGLALTMFIIGLRGKPKRGRGCSPKGTSINLASDELYWELLPKIQEYQRAKDYTRMLECCRRSLPVLPAMVAGVKMMNRKFGRTSSFDIVRIPAIEIGCRYWAALEDRATLNVLCQVVYAVPDLKRDWGEVVDNALADADLCAKVKALLKNNVGCLQNEIGKTLGASGQSVARLLRTLDNLGMIRRVPNGKTYKVHLA